MNLLEAVNAVLHHLNEVAVTGLSVANPTVGLVVPALNNARIELLTHEWFFNTFEWRELIPDATGQISIANEVLGIYPQDPKYVWDGKRIVHADTGLPCTVAIVARVVFDKAFEDLPAVAQQYVIAQAAQRVYIADFGVDGASQNLQNIAQAAYHTLTAQHVRTRKYTAKQRPAWQKFRRRLFN